MSDLFTREIKIETGAIRSFQSLLEVTVSGDHFGAKYQNVFEMPDASKLSGLSFTTDRSIADAVGKNDFVEFNGVQITLTDFIAIAAQFSEKWRIEDEAVKPPDPLPGGLGGAIAVP